MNERRGYRVYTVIETTTPGQLLSSDRVEGKGRLSGS